MIEILADDIERLRQGCSATLFAVDGVAVSIPWTYTVHEGVGAVETPME